MIKPKLTWLLVPISIGAFVATWGGWAKLATMTGFGDTELIPGSGMTFNTGIVLPLTVEPFGALAMALAFNVKLRPWARVIAGVMAVSTLVAAGICQVVVHQLTVTGAKVAPPEIVGITSVLPVIALGLSGALAMLSKTAMDEPDPDATPRPSGTSQWAGMLGRIAQAATDRTVSRLERPIEASQRDDESVPAMPVPVSPAVDIPNVPAGQSRLLVPARPALDKDPGTIMQVAQWLQEEPRPTVDQIASRLETSRSVAGRVAKEARQMVEAGR